VSAPSDSELRRIFVEALGSIAPEADLASLDPNAELRDELEIDSIDVLNLAIALHDATGIDIPERDSTELATLAAGADVSRLPRLDAYYLQAPGRIESFGTPSFGRWLASRALLRRIRAGVIRPRRPAPAGASLNRRAEEP